MSAQKASRYPLFLVFAGSILRGRGRAGTTGGRGGVVSGVAGARNDKFAALPGDETRFGLLGLRSSWLSGGHRRRIAVRRVFGLGSS